MGGTSETTCRQFSKDLRPHQNAETAPEAQSCSDVLDEVRALHALKPGIAGAIDNREHP
jgi:hypothetical protein